MRFGLRGRLPTSRSSAATTDVPAHTPTGAALLAQGLAHHQAGRLAEAETCYRRLLDADPDNADGLHLLGVLAHQAGRLEAAATLISDAIRRKANDGAYFNNLGSVRLALDQPAAAAENFARALALNGDSPGTRNNLGLALHQQGKSAQALPVLDQALRTAPDFAMAHNNRGLVCAALDRPRDAALSYRRALTLVPDLPNAWQNLGFHLSAASQPDAALPCLARAARLAGATAVLCRGIGSAERDLGRQTAAIGAYRRALLLTPDDAVVWYTLANMLYEPKSMRQALICLRRVLLLEASDERDASALAKRAFGFWAHARQMFCDWEAAADEERRVLDIVRSDETEIAPFVLLSMASTPDDQLRCARRWMASHYGKVVPMPTPRRPSGRGRIRVGYLSADFRRHAMSYLITEVLEQHDRQRFEVIAYSIGKDDGGPERKRVERAVDSFVALDPYARNAAHRIRDDQIDILVDLMGLTSHARPEILAARPAPVQVAVQGFPATTGASFIDYLIADPIVAPFDQQPFFTEKIVQLPGCYQPNDSQRQIAAYVPSRGDCGLPESGFVFCCFNGSFKLNPDVFDRWMRLLRDVPGSVLWLIASHPITMENLRSESVARGVSGDRLIFAPHLPLANHLARHRHADLFLDTLPCNAHTTASDALWAGLPLLTCLGTTFAGRVAASLLHALDLPDLITDTLDHYEEMALRLATDPSTLEDVRRRLDTNRVHSSLFKGESFARSIESAYTTMWQRWSDGLPPAPFAVA